jgi:hypothetical protein
VYRRPPGAPRAMLSRRTGPCVARR